MSEEPLLWLFIFGRGGALRGLRWDVTDRWSADARVRLLVENAGDLEANEWSIIASRRHCGLDSWWRDHGSRLRGLLVYSSHLSVKVGTSICELDKFRIRSIILAKLRCKLDIWLNIASIVVYKVLNSVQSEHLISLSKLVLLLCRFLHRMLLQKQLMLR